MPPKSPRRGKSATSPRVAKAAGATLLRINSRRGCEKKNEEPLVGKPLLTLLQVIITSRDGELPSTRGSRVLAARRFTSGAIYALSSLQRPFHVALLGPQPRGCSLGFVRVMCCRMRSDFIFRECCRGFPIFIGKLFLEVLEICGSREIFLTEIYVQSVV